MQTTSRLSTQRAYSLSLSLVAMFAQLIDQPFGIPLTLSTLVLSSLRILLCWFRAIALSGFDKLATDHNNTRETSENAFCDLLVRVALCCTRFWHELESH